MFTDNTGLTTNGAVNTESIGGALYLIAENVTLVNILFYGNRAYFAGCIYINMNNQKNYLNFTGYRLNFTKNYADNTGGAIFLDADIMSADILIAASVFSENGASDCKKKIFYF